MVDIPKGFKAVEQEKPVVEAPPGFKIVQAVDEELPSFGRPGEELPPTQTREEREEAALERQGPGALARIGEAIAEPFRETEFGLDPETVEQFTQSPIDIVNTFNKVLIGGGVSAAFSLLQGVGAASESAIKGITQTLRETGVLDATTARKFERDATEILDLGALQVGVSPGALRRGVGRGRTAAQLEQEEAQAARVLQERNLPQKVPLTQADVTQDINLQSQLDEASQGLLGERAKALADQVKVEQSQGLRGNVEEFQKAVSGRETALAAQEAGLGVDRASQAIKIAAGDAKRAIRDAYDQAKSLDASIDGDLVKSFGQSARKSLIDEGFDITDSPKLAKSLNEIEDLKLIDGKVTEATVNNLELWRKRVNKRIQSVRASDPAEAESLRRLKSDYDQFSSDVLDEGLIRGNDEAIRAWRKARDLRTDFGRRFNDDATIKKIVNESLTQEESVNLIFGGSQMGFKTQAGGIVQKMKAVLGEQSEAFKSLKEEAILRLVKNQSDVADFSGAKFNTAFEKAMKNNQTLMRELFTPEELIDLRNFARFSRDVTVKKAGATNPPGTFNKLARFMQGTGINSNFVSKFMNAAFGAIITPAKEARAAQRIEEIINFKQKTDRIRTDPELFRTAIAASIAAPEAE